MEFINYKCENVQPKMKREIDCCAIWILYRAFCNNSLLWLIQTIKSHISFFFFFFCTGLTEDIYKEKLVINKSKSKIHVTLQSKFRLAPLVYALCFKNYF